MNNTGDYHLKIYKGKSIDIKSIPIENRYEYILKYQINLTLDEIEYIDANLKKVLEPTELVLSLINEFIWIELFEGEMPLTLDPADYRCTPEEGKEVITKLLTQYRLNG